MFEKIRYIILATLFQLTSLSLIAQLKANFTASSISGCSPLTETFNDATTGGTGSYSYLWRLGNSNNSFTKNPSAIYYLPGTYKITLVVSDANGNRDSIIKIITVLKNPTASFTVARQTGCVPFGAYFTDQSSPGSIKLTKWLWDFGDGNTSTSQNPGYHTYSAAGKYSVSLVVTDSTGCNAYTSKPGYIYADDPPIVSFSATPTSSCTAPLTVNFYSKVTSSSSLNYFWDFGDGTTSTSSNPVKTYSIKGIYTVKLSVTDSLGCTASQTSPDYIIVGHLDGSFTYSLPGGCAPLAISFSNTSVGLPSGSNFKWNFGDGGTSTDENPTHIYTPGSYKVTFMVTSPGGCSDTVVMQDSIRASVPYQASFLADSILCQYPYQGIFKNTSGHNTKVVYWHFGDSIKPYYQGGDPASHYFPDSGTFTITMKVQDQNGCLESVTKQNLVRTGPTVAAFVTDITKGCAPITVNITNKSTSTVDKIVSYLWNFGDGTTSNLKDPGSHTYSDTGQYKLSLEVKTKLGCVAVDTVKIRAARKPIVKFTFSPDSGCLSMLRNMQFHYQAFGLPTLKDDSGSLKYDSTILLIFPNIKHSGNPEKQPGTYVYSLVAYAHGACPGDTFTSPTPLIVDPPWADYIPHDDTCSSQNIVSFTDFSIGGSRVEYYFGDGDSSSLRNPTHVYKDTGYYYPYEVVYDSSNGCSDSYSFYSFPLQGLFIKPPWFAAVQAGPTSGCTPLKVVFKVYDGDTSDNVVYFGDGTSTNIHTTGVKGFPEVFFTHIYQTPGVYKVTMLSTHNGTCKQVFNMNPEIIVVGMHQGFSVSPVRGCIPLTVTLVDSFSSDSAITKNIFDMGNGDIVKVTSHVMTYTYKKPPANQDNGFKIRYILSNGYCTDTQTQNVFPQQPVCQIYPFNISNCNSVSYQFVHGVATGFAPFKYLWVFGKGDTDVSSQPTRTYPVGSYYAKLKVTDSMGCIDTVSYSVVVPSTKDSAGFDVNLSSGNCPPVTAQFIDKSKFSVPGPRKWIWDFGDGSGSSNQSPSKIYSTAGTFTVTLKITDILGCTSTMTKPNLVVINGAKGEYSFNPKKGCGPLSVNFAATSGTATKFVWDFGDGAIGNSDTVTHVYKNPGTFIPLLLLGDKSGCQYTLPPKDTITVYPPPHPDFSYDSTCSGQPIHFKDLSTAVVGVLAQWVWVFGDGSILDEDQNPSHVYKKNGFYPVKLTVENDYGCTNSITKSVKYGDIIARIKVSKTGCLGSPAQFKDLSLSDSAIKSWYWLFGDGSSSTLQNPSHVYTAKGIYPISLYVQNYKGCYDSLKNGAYIIIGDTVPPKPPVIYRVTVADDHTTELDFGQNHDLDFEKYLIYIRDENGNVKLADSVFNSADTVRMEQGLNNLHHSFCFLVQAVDVCGYQSDTDASLYHCTINLNAAPAVNEAILSWTPYTGWAVGQYKIYRQASETPPQFNILDSVPGSQLKYIDTSVICYRRMVYRVEGFEKNGNRQVSWSDTAATIPVHVAHVPQADMVRATVENNKNAVVEWKAVPNGHVKNWMLEKSVDGINFQLIDTPIKANVDSEYDQKVDVQNNSYTYRLRILDSCGDIGPYSHIGKTILLHVDTNADVKPLLVWSPYKDWPEGVQYYDIDIENSGNGFDWLARTVTGQDTVFVDNITDLNSLPFYTYHVVAHRNGTLSSPDKNIHITSMSNDGTLKPHPRLFIPNAFTPNGDGINDSFFVEGLYVKEFHIRIFDRWGTKVFESGSMKDKWSGRFKNGQPILDAYKYLIYYRGVENIDHYAIGWVTLLE